MEDTLVRDDRVIVSKLTPGPFDLHRGDVVVFEDPGTGSTPWLRGRQQQQHRRRRRSTRPSSSSACCPRTPRTTSSSGSSGCPATACSSDGGSRPIRSTACRSPSPTSSRATPRARARRSTSRVPAGHVWVMGDHRSDSSDCRFHDDGTGATGSVPIDKIVGRALFVVWPIDHVTWLGVPERPSPRCRRHHAVARRPTSGPSGAVEPATRAAADVDGRCVQPRSPRSRPCGSSAPCSAPATACSPAWTRSDAGRSPARSASASSSSTRPCRSAPTGVKDSKLLTPARPPGAGAAHPALGRRVCRRARLARGDRRDRHHGRAAAGRPARPRAPWASCPTSSSSTATTTGSRRPTRWACSPSPTTRRPATPPVTTMIKADLKCSSVAAASVLAKVERDALMMEARTGAPGIRLGGEQGVCRARAPAALQAHGPCALHRRSWRLPGTTGETMA